MQTLSAVGYGVVGAVGAWVVGAGVGEVGADVCIKRQPFLK